jgi:predicted nucleic acid-binding protein
MITLDSSVVIAHLQPRDPHHEAATAYLREHTNEVLLIHSLNLAEVLAGGVRAGRGQEMLGDIQAVGVQVADPTEGEPLRLATLRAESGLKLPDCCALETAMVSTSVLATFDVALAEAARRRHLTVAPGPGPVPADPSPRRSEIVGGPACPGR